MHIKDGKQLLDIPLDVRPRRLQTDSDYTGKGHLQTQYVAA